MSRKREVLAALKRDELVAAVEGYELEVSDKRSKDGLVDALARARRVEVAKVLETLSRDRLKEICRTLELDDSGREKAAIIERIVGGGAKGADSEPPAAAASGPGGTLTQQALERHLWAAADILRGSIDSSDYKNYIFGLLFLKRLSDRFDEECELLRAEGIDPEDEDEHEFFVPPKARWPQIQKAATGIGEALNKACGAVEDANGTLEGVLLGIDFNDERRLGDARQRDNVLARLVQHFAKIDLRNASLSEPDMLGRAYEYLIEKFADDAGKKGGEFYTPHKVVQLIVELLEPKEGMRICDPTAGSGGMLIECARYVERHGGNPKNLSLYGQEKNLGTWAICKMNMLLHGIRSGEIMKGDTIRDPKLVERGALMQFDRVIANPPFSLDDWGREFAEHDPHGRFRFGVPPRSKGDLAFVQHMVATLNHKGRLGVVMPHGVLFRAASESEIRRGLLKEDLVEAVIGLPPNLFYGTGIPAAIVMMNRAKPEARRKKILFVEASREYREGSAQNFLRDEDLKKIVATFHAFSDVERYARVVNVDEVLKIGDCNLNISRYVETGEHAEVMDVGEALRRLRQAEASRDAARAEMDRLLKEMGLDG